MCMQQAALTSLARSCIDRQATGDIRECQRCGLDFNSMYNMSPLHHTHDTYTQVSVINVNCSHTHLSLLCRVSVLSMSTHSQSPTYPTHCNTCTQGPVITVSSMCTQFSQMQERIYKLNSLLSGVGGCLWKKNVRFTLLQFPTCLHHFPFELRLYRLSIFNCKMAGRPAQQHWHLHELQ